MKTVVLSSLVVATLAGCGTDHRKPDDGTGSGDDVPYTECAGDAASFVRQSFLALDGRRPKSQAEVDVYVEIYEAVKAKGGDPKEGGKPGESKDAGKQGGDPKGGDPKGGQQSASKGDSKGQQDGKAQAKGGQQARRSVGPPGAPDRRARRQGPVGHRRLHAGRGRRAGAMEPP